MAFTVSADVSNFTILLGLKVFVVTGATEAGGANAGSAGTFGVENVSLTPAQTGSLILFGLSASAGTWTAYTAASNNTLVDNTQEGTTGYGYGDGYYSGTVTSGTPVTVGTSAPSQWNALAAYELIPSSGTTTPLIDASTPALANGPSSPQTTVSFTPTAGSVLVAVVMSDTTAAGAVTMSDTSGLGLTWTQRALYQSAFEGLVGIYTATIPGGGTSTPTPHTATGAGVAAYGAQAALTLTEQAPLTAAGAPASPSASATGGTTVLAGAATGSGSAAQAIDSVTVLAGVAAGAATGSGQAVSSASSTVAPAAAAGAGSALSPPVLVSSRTVLPGVATGRGVLARPGTPGSILPVGYLQSRPPQQLGQMTAQPGAPGGPGGPQGPAAPAGGAGWEVRVLAAPDYHVLLAVIPPKMLSGQGVQFVKQLNDAQGGSGSVTLNMDDSFWTSVMLPNGQPAHYLLDYQHVWSVWQDGVWRYDFFGETVTEQLADGSEQRIATVAGPGTLSALKWAMVAPPGFPSNIIYKLDAISDGFSEVDANGNYVLDTGLWNATLNTGHIALNPAGSARLTASPGTTILGTTAYDAINTLISAQVSPIVSPDAAGNNLNGSQVTQFYIQDTTGTGYYALIGLSGTTFYAQFKGPSGVFTKTIASAAQFGAAAQGTNNYAYWQITEKNGSFFFWTSGDGTNWTQQWQVAHNWSPVSVGFYFAATYSADNTESATITSVNSNVTTSTLGGPLYYGQPVIAAWLDQLTKAQARGTVPFVTTGRLSAATDSFGNPWTDSQSVQLQNGTDLLALLQGHAAMIDADYIMQPGFRLQIGTPQAGSITLGADRSSQVVFRDGYDSTSRVRTRTRNQIQNLIAVINSDSRTITAANTTSEAAWGQREAWVQAAVQVTQADISVVGAATVQAAGSELLSWTLQVSPWRPGRDIFGSYDVGDWVGLERPDFSAVDKVRVIAIAVQVSPDGSETHELTLESYLQFLQERLTYIAGKLGGNFISAAGTTAVPGNGSITTQNAPTVFAPTLAGLGDVLLGGSGGSSPLVYDPVTGMWVPAGSTNQVTGAPQPLQVTGPNGTVTVSGDGSGVTVSGPQVVPPDGGLPLPSAQVVTTPNGYVITDANGLTRIIAGSQSDGTITITQSGGTAPGIPDTPAVTGSLQSLVVTWDGLLAGAAPLLDFLYVQVHVSTSSGFTPSSSTLAGVLHSAGSYLVGGLSAGTTYYAKLVAYNQSLVASTPSAQASGSPSTLGSSTIGMVGVLNANPYFTSGDGSTWTGYFGTFSVSSSPPAGSPLPYAGFFTITTAGSGAAALENGQFFRVIGSSAYLATAWVYSSTTTVVLTFWWHDSSRSFLSFGQQTFTVPANTWSLVTTVQTSPSNAAWAFLGISPADGVGHSIYFEQVLCLPQVPGSLIQAGTITANQIAANTITANQIAANTITANQIAAQAITATQIAAGTITAAQIQSGTITAGQIAAGTITASLLAANIIVAGIVDGTVVTGATVVADGTSGELLVYTGTPASGNLLFSVSGADGSDLHSNAFSQGLQLVALSGLTNLFTVVDTSGNTLAGIDSSGNVSGQVINAAMDLQVGGQSVSALTGSAALGMVNYGFQAVGGTAWPSTPIGATKVALFELDQAVTGGRIYEFVMNQTIVNVSGGAGSVHLYLHYTTDGTTPTTSSAIATECASRVETTATDAAIGPLRCVFTPSSDGTYKFLVSGNIGANSFQFKNDPYIRCMVYDMGSASLVNNLNVLGSGSSGGSSAQTYTEYFYPAATHSYFSGSGLRNTNGSMYHGAYSGESDYQYSYITWATGSLGNNLNTVLNYTVNSVGLRLTNLHSWYAGGMTFGLHSSTSLGGGSGTYSTLLGSEFISEGNTFEYSLGSSMWSPFAAGGTTYLVLAPDAANQHNLSWYGYFFGYSATDTAHVPRLRVNYTH